MAEGKDPAIAPWIDSSHAESWTQCVKQTITLGETSRGSRFEMVQELSRAGWEQYP